MQHLKRLLRTKAIKFAEPNQEFKLSNGQMSNVFCDIKPILLSSNAGEIASPILDIIENFEAEHNKIVDAIVGIPLGGLLLACAVTYKYINTNLPMLVVRKESKGHGTNLLIEGDVRAKMNVILLEDVITTGTSALAVIKILKEANVNVCAVLSVVDRSNGIAQEILPNFNSLFNLDDLI